MYLHGGLWQVEKFTSMARERLELGRALVKASEKAANPKAKAKAAPKASAKAAAEISAAS